MFGEKILDYWDDILRDLGKVVAIPSVAGKEENGHPFGDNCAKVLDTVLEMAEGYGLKTKNVDYYAGHAEIGEGEGNAIVMAHLDVVPAGEGWDTDPFTMTLTDNNAFGRGVSDNKGAAIVALHCLRALKDAGVVGKRKLRVVLGCAEEIGMADMAHYFSKEQHPDMGFTPDASYGICHCEKGIINFRVTGKNTSSVVKSFSAGTVVNAVPAKAQCEILCTPEELKKLEALGKDSPAQVDITPTENGASLLIKGKAAHASRPQGGLNAAACGIELICAAFSPDRVGPFLSFIHDKIAMANDGSKIGVAMSDEPSGPLTFNLGLLQITPEECSLTVDIRYPATKKGSEISEILKKAVDAYPGLTFTLLSDADPLYLPKESPLIVLLSGAYKDITGEECQVFSMGGGTYARQMFGKGVAFGASFPDQEDGHAHDVNECIDLRRFKLHAEICLEAMYRMFTCD